MGLKVKARISSFLFLILVMNIFLNEELGGDSASISNTSVSCNGTIGDCFLGYEDEVGEFLRYSVGGRWLLQAQKHISYNGLQRPPVCNAPQYGDCIVQVNTQNRPCTDYNRCKRVP